MIDILTKLQQELCKNLITKSLEDSSFCFLDRHLSYCNVLDNKMTCKKVKTRILYHKKR